MKLFIKFLIFVLILGLVGPFILRTPEGEPYLDYRDFIPSFSSLKSKTQGVWNNIDNPLADDSDNDAESAAGNVRVYKWQDENGVWQYSDVPPTGMNRETVYINTRENIVPGAPPPQENAEEVEETADEAEDGPDIAVPLPLTVPVSEVPTLIQDAKNVQELMNKRNEILDSN